jgi:hypothetical protein
MDPQQCACYPVRYPDCYPVSGLDHFSPFQVERPVAATITANARKMGYCCQQFDSGLSKPWPMQSISRSSSRALTSGTLGGRKNLQFVPISAGRTLQGRISPRRVSTGRTSSGRILARRTSRGRLSSGRTSTEPGKGKRADDPITSMRENRGVEISNRADGGLFFRLLAKAGFA